MKKGLILVGDYSEFEKEMNTSKQFFDKLNLSVELVNFNDINVIATEPNGKIYIKGKEADLPDFVFVFAVREREEYKFRAVLRMFETLGVKSINSLDSIEKVGDKVYSFQIAKQFVPEIKMPKTILLSPDVPLNMIEEEIGFPLVLKVINGTQGRDVCLIKTKDEFLEALDSISKNEPYKEFLVQEAIMSSQGRDIRIVIAGGELIHSFVRHNENHFRSNLHQGGSMEKFDPPQSLIDISIKLADALGLRFGSIDFLFGEDEDEFYLCEVNSLPGISYIFEAISTGDTELINRFLSKFKKIIFEELE